MTLFPFGSGPSIGGGFTTPFEMLEACHGRIRSFTQISRRLATERAPGEQVAEAASGLHLYFGTALPLHEQDEEDTLWTALTGRADASRLDPLFERLRREHRAIERVLAELLPRWEELAAAPQRVTEEQPRLAGLTSALEAAFTPHLAMEEEELYPLAQQSLPQAMLAPMLDAMRKRRQPVFGKLRKLQHA